MLTLSTVKFVNSHISPTKHKTYLLKTSLIMQTRTEENPWKYFQILQSYCCSPATFLPSMSHLCKGTGVDKKTSSLPRSRGITSPVQWLSTQWSRLNSTDLHTKNHPDDTTGGFSMQLMVEYSLYSEQKLALWIWQDSALPESVLLALWGESRSVQLLSTAFNIIRSKKNQCDSPITFIGWRITCQLPLSRLISVWFD